MWFIHYNNNNNKNTNRHTITRSLVTLAANRIIWTCLWRFSSYYFTKFPPRIKVSLNVVYYFHGKMSQILKRCSLQCWRLFSGLYEPTYYFKRELRKNCVMQCKLILLESSFQAFWPWNDLSPFISIANCFPLKCFP